MAVDYMNMINKKAAGTDLSRLECKPMKGLGETLPFHWFTYSGRDELVYVLS